LNLLVNAAEATSNGEPIRVAYGLRRDVAFVEVRDSGCGMSTEFIENHLFRPFDTTKKHGFGIGLYQCKQIVESHQGSISIESEEGKGTMFTLLLPLSPEIG
jgi:signal transduction histidine kinase